MTAFNATKQMERLDNSERSSWIDLSRVIAILGVIFIHSSGPFFYQIQSISKFEWLSVNFIESATRCSVPIFMMISGALLLKESGYCFSIKTIYKRIMRVFVPLVIWSILFLYYTSYYTGEKINPTQILIKPAMYHLWFIYAIIGVYLTLPILQSIFSTMLKSNQFTIYFFCLWLIYTSMPIYINLPLAKLLQLNELFGYGGYFLLGGVIKSKSKNHNPKNPVLISIYIISVLITFLITTYLSFKTNSGNETAYQYFSINVFASSISMFFILSRIDLGISVGKIFEWLSDKCFLIFFMHPIVLERVVNAIKSISPLIPLSILILLSTVITFVICIVISHIIRMIPSSRKFFG